MFIYMYEGDRVDGSIFLGGVSIFGGSHEVYGSFSLKGGGFYFSVFGKFWIRAMLRKVLAELLPSLR